MTYSPAWLDEARGAIRQNWPLIPLPGDADTLAASAALGRRVAALLDLDTPVRGITTGRLLPELTTIAVPTTGPGASRNWTLSGWGSRTAAGVTMPGRGRAEERAWSRAEAACERQSALLGTVIPGTV